MVVTCGDILFAAAIGAASVDQRAGGADLQTGPALNTGRFAERHVQVSDNHAFTPAVFEVERVIGRDLVTGSDAAGAENAAVVIHDKVFAGDASTSIFS